MLRCSLVSACLRWVSTPSLLILPCHATWPAQQAQLGASLHARVHGRPSALALGAHASRAPPTCALAACRCG